MPTIAESGVPGYAVFAWVGLVVPAGTPPDVVQKLSRELTAILKSPDVEKKIDDLGARTFLSTPDAFGALIKSEVTKFAGIIRSAGVKLE